MRKLVFLLFGLTFFFTINLLLYVLSEDYRFLIKKIKYDDTVVYERQIEVSDEQDILTASGIQDVSVDLPNTSTWSVGQKTTIEVNAKKTGAIALSITGEDILKRFSSFGLEKTSEHSSLFGITSEYPDDYFEYLWESLTLYFFPTKNYYDVRDIFDTLSFELPFRINQVNNFGDKSFYINLKTWFEDDYIRIVVLSGESVFWLKIKKDVYNEARKILENLDAPFWETSSGAINSEKTTN